MIDRTLIDGLMRPQAYPHPVGSIRLHETHISWVLLTGEFAYKIKKPVALPFLDFTTLDKRRHFCDEELRLNRRTAPAVYLDVVPVTGTRTAPRIGGDGPVIDYAVRMRQFDDGARLDKVLADGRLDPAELAQFGETLAGFHDAADASESAVRGAPDAIAARLRRNLEELEALATGTEGARLQILGQWTEATLGRLEDLLEARAADGRIAECHGDLHLRNLVRLDGEIHPFDCIEFDPALRWIDVIDDLAFPVMDLELNGAEDAASVLVDAYLRASGDYSGIRLLDLYVIYRALVRAKVAAIERAEADGAGAADATSRVARLIELAEAHTRPREPCLVLMHGLPASGKSRVAGMLVPALPAIRISSDIERKRLAGLERQARSGSPIGGGLYAADRNQETYARLAALAGTVLASGRHVIVDATFLRLGDRETFYSLARGLGCDARLVRCTAPADVLNERVLARSRGPADSEADRQVLDHARKVVEPVTGKEPVTVVEVDTSVPYTAAGIAAAILDGGRRRHYSAPRG